MDGFETRNLVSSLFFLKKNITYSSIIIKLKLKTMMSGRFTRQTRTLFACCVADHSVADQTCRLFLILITLHHVNAALSTFP